MDDLEVWARMGTAQLRALVIPPRHCRHCGVELEARPGPGRPLIWRETHRTAIGRRPAGRVCAGCGASLDGRRRQAVVCGERCRSRIRRQTPGVNGWAPRSPTGATGRPGGTMRGAVASESGLPWPGALPALAIRIAVPSPRVDAPYLACIRVSPPFPVYVASPSTTYVSTGPALATSGGSVHRPARSQTVPSGALSAE